MSDLISRQDAIEVIEEMQMPIMRSMFPEEQFVFKGMSEALSAIKDLPSAQPEIVRCKDCKHYKAYEYTGKLACHYVIGGTVEKKPDDFCSRAERITDERFD